jgi:hypothetical protein
MDIAGVGRVFNVVNNLQFWFFKYFKQENCWFKAFEKKNQNQRTVGGGYFKNLKYLLVFMKELKVFWAVIVSFSKTIENCSYISKPDIDFFENHRYEP